MSEKPKACLRGWKAVGAGFALLSAAALPSHAAAQQANQPANQVATAPADAITVVRDAETGKLRAPTEAELQTLKLAGQASRIRATPAHTMQKFHANGATGVRLTDEFVSTALAVRNSKGGVDMQCLEQGHSAQDVHSDSSHTNQPVEE
jgi:hypothetical protein